MNDDALDRLKAALADRYAIERELGSGGMAIVYLAEDRRHERQVAIKVLRPELTSVVAAERFLREIKLTAGLAHPHILPLLDSGEADGFLYYAMPYAEGESVRRRLERQGRLPVDEAVRIAREVADALSYAHERDLMHRDIKPENILLEAGHAVVADFGIARAITVAGGQKLTDTGVSVGTPAYMSPEQAAGETDLDEKSDVYSLACVLYEMLGGEVPHGGESPREIFAKRLLGELRSVRELRPDVSPAVDALLKKALQVDAAERFSSAAEFARALPAPTMHRPTMWRASLVSVRETWIRHRWFVLIAGITLLAVASLFKWGRPVRFIEYIVTQQAADAVSPGRIAVLEIEDLSEEQGFSSLAASFTEILVYELDQISSLEVLPRHAVTSYLEAGIPLDSVLRALEVDALLKGSFMGSRERLRLTVQLVDAETLAHIESTMLETTWDDPLKLSDDLAFEVLSLLHRELGIVSPRQIRAAELLERAADLRESAGPSMMSGDTTAVLSALERADSLLAQAEALDPNWVEPIVQRGWVAADQARLAGDSRGYEPEYTRRGLAHAERAVSMDPTGPGALELRGTLRRYLWESADSTEATELLEGAETDLRAAVAIDASRAGAWSSLSRIYRVTGRFAEANTAAERAYMADELTPDARNVIFTLCHTSFELKEFDDVLRWCGEGRQRFPDRRSFVMLELLALSGHEGPEPDPDAAWRLAQKFEELSPPQNRAQARATGLLQVAAVLARSDLADSAEAVIVQAHAASEPYEMTYYYEANARLQLGQRDQAIELLGRYLEARPDRKSYLSEDWWWTSLWEHPDFKALVEER